MKPFFSVEAASILQALICVKVNNNFLCLVGKHSKEFSRINDWGPRAKMHKK